MIEATREREERGGMEREKDREIDENLRERREKSA